MILLTGAAAAFTGSQGLAALNEQRSQQETLRAEVERLEQEAADFRDEIALLRRDPAALELLAKTRHQLVEPGEMVVLLRFPERYGPERP